MVSRETIRRRLTENELKAWALEMFESGALWPGRLTNPSIPPCRGTSRRKPKSAPGFSYYKGRTGCLRWCFRVRAARDALTN
jgi:hypothetical protein